MPNHMLFGVFVLDQNGDVVPVTLGLKNNVRPNVVSRGDRGLWSERVCGF